MSEVYKSRYATDIKKLRYNGLLDRAFFGAESVNEVVRMIYNGEVVFNRAFFELWSENTVELEAEGTREEPLYKVLDVVSRKRDYDGKITEVVFEGADEVIEPNTTDEEKSGTFTIRQRYSNLEIAGTWTQKKDEVKDIEYQYVESVDVAYDGELPATQSLVNPRVTIYYVVKKYYSSNEIKTETLKTNGVVTYAKGRVQNSSGAYIDTSNGDVYSINLGKKPSPYQEAYVVNEMSGTFQVTDKNGTNSYDWTWTGNHVIKQSANEKRNNGVAYYDFDPTLSAYRITGDANDIYVKANAFYIQPTIWTSLVEDRDISKTFADLSVNNGTLDDSRIEGGNETIWHITKNGESARRVSITFSNSLDGYNNTLYVDQDAYSESVTWSTPVLNGSITWQIPANGAAVSFVVPLRQYKYKDGDIIGTYDWDAMATYVEGSSVTANASFSDGRISCDSMGTDYYPSGREVFYATQIKANGKDGVEYDIEIPDSILSIYQDINIEVDRDEDYHISNSVPADGTTIEGEETTIWVYINATYDVVATWSSGATARGTYDLPISISAPDCVPNSTSASGNTSVMLTVRKNETGASRTISVSLSNGAANYSEEFTFTQKAYVEQEVWMYPQLNGTVSVGEIPADGSGVAISANITQNKTKGGTVIETRTLSISGIGGSAVSGTGVSFADGKISADSMGTTEYKSGRKVYSLTTLKVYGADGVSYDIPLSSAVEIRQAANVKSEAGYGDYKLSVSASPSSGISSMGGTATITASAQIQKLYTWSSGADGGSEYVNSNGNLSVSPAGVATITPASIIGTNQTATLRISTENTSPKPKVFTVTLEVGGRTATCTVTQNESSYPIEVWKFPSGTICESKKWYLGQVDTGYTRLGGVPVYHIVAATTEAYKDSDAQITAKFSYAYKHSSGDYSGTYNTPVYYNGGTEITINGKVYYGVILVEDLTGLTQGTVDTFSVMGGGDIT